MVKRDRFNALARKVYKGFPEIHGQTFGQISTKNLDEYEARFIAELKEDGYHWEDMEPAEFRTKWETALTNLAKKWRRDNPTKSTKLPYDPTKEGTSSSGA
ncbi:hypothetical protein P171DRAFT_436474 [Karstenula rhodostoma CBS 690.94]|uniref:Uncharacterized protein n=1 Tax=Karstenula rhodostoma CBS 690.94 TaxID=1392251 RepID=A0A9P4U6U1_9PLEO|nr:hypothetical protein P171DRAFT_436474 [Karstenula rhodostoma CBS 690.94]